MVFLYIRHIETLCEPVNAFIVELGNILPYTENEGTCARCPVDGDK